MKIRAVIIEDEEPARELLKKYLSSEADIELIGEFTDGFSAAVGVNKDKPDLIFLDIQLPRLNGFEFLELLDYTPQIIFTTAYDEFAIKAFEQNATDYLLKPFSHDRLSKAVSKAREKYSVQPQQTKPVEEITENLTASMPLTRIVVKDSKGINVIPVNEVLYFEAQDDYVMIHTAKGRYMKKQTLKGLEQRLNPNQFIRIHRAYIANSTEIQRIEPYEKDSFIAILKSNAKLKVSATGYKNLKERLGF